MLHFKHQLLSFLPLGKLLSPPMLVVHQLLLLTLDASKALRQGLLVPLQRFNFPLQGLDGSETCLVVLQRWGRRRVSRTRARYLCQLVGAWSQRNDPGPATVRECLPWMGVDETAEAAGENALRAPVFGWIVGRKRYCTATPDLPGACADARPRF
ncbi:hypothetical protein CBS13152_11396 [Aspergillus niger]|nr:hypothetical protein CBS13152_11396 [Aspergillus niger]